VKKIHTFLVVFIILAILIYYAPAVFLFIHTNSSDNLSKSEIFKLVEKNEDILLGDISANNFNDSSEIKGIVDVNIEEEIINFYCGGYGMGPSTGYYGFYYTEDDNMTAIWCSGSPLKQDGKGYSWEEDDGDNRYYTEKICDNFYYYEAHF